MTVIRPDAPGHEWVRADKDDGATRIWVAGGSPMPQGLDVGLHRHDGDEFFQVLAGTVRVHVDGRNIDVGEGSFVVVPPTPTPTPTGRPDSLTAASSHYPG